MTDTRPTRSPLVLIAALVAAALSAAGCAPSSSAGEPRPAERPLAVIYDGPQGCPDCAPAVAKVLRKAPRHYRIRFVKAPVKASDLAGAKLYVQPGGGADLERTWRDLKESADVLRTWVREGGSYLGLCFGAYLAGRNPGFGLLPGDAGGYTDSRGAVVDDDRDTVLKVMWRGKPRHMYFQDGPVFHFGRGADATSVEVLATYPGNGLPAAAVARYGKGRVGVSGPHPEADASWYEGAGLKNPDGVRPDLAYDLIEATAD
ncbi:BPL-N domain-containing protein [Streptomyces sp. NPDC050703]|uniref:BPL-N domain-containing protein n=1 Tax=Streptomyces sp. NPDC050703 TaxID=3157218 RepID=UPI00344501DA